jgi:DNA-binding NarL/FixJ family response regulator
MTAGEKPMQKNPTRVLLVDTYGLTIREIEVLQLLIEGKSNGQIARALFVSVETVKTHVRHVMQKMMVSDRRQAASKAMNQGMERNTQHLSEPDASVGSP